MNWFDKNMNGLCNMGPITIYGQNAMHWAVNIKIPKCYICFRLPLRCFGKWWPLYLYISENATPGSSTILFGNGQSIDNKVAAKFRRKIFGIFYTKRGYFGEIFNILENEHENLKKRHIIQFWARKMVKEYIIQQSEIFKPIENGRISKFEENLDILIKRIENSHVDISTYFHRESPLKYKQLRFFDEIGNIADVRINDSNYIQIDMQTSMLKLMENPEF